MQKTPLSLLTARTRTNFAYDIPIYKSEMILWIMKILLIDIYKRLNMKVTKRVINVIKRVQTFDVINNQKIVNLKGLHLSGSCGNT